ncbi:hypothetical protein CVS40_0878 [Lucilia cuprina]|nr:hypothetical protein CVS40_0878 [Lucilia cuprina]
MEYITQYFANPRETGSIASLPRMKYVNKSMGTAGESPITSDASRRARDAFCSPSAAMTLARASRAASASAAMALCSCTGRRTSLLEFLGFG